MTGLDELGLITKILSDICEELRIMNMISLEKWDNKIEGYDQTLTDKETRSVVRDQIKFFQTYYKDLQIKQTEFFDKREKEWEERNLKRKND